MTDACVVLVMTPDREVAFGIARTVVEERLAACGNVLPGATSVYRWKGEIQEEGECLLILKSRKSVVAGLQARVSELHPYEVPEILVLEVADGHPPYLAWITEETGGG